MANGKRVNAATEEAVTTVIETKGATKAARPRSRAAKRPKLGQNFLVDVSAVQRIVEALGDVSQKIVIEIGPGKGVLTDKLAARAGHLIAIELDRVLAAQLRMRYNRLDNVEIIEGDVLTMDFSSMLGPRPGMLVDRSPHALPTTARLVGNIPYYITSDILLRLFSFHTSFDEVILMLQKEVADRLLAQPGNSEYGLLSATAQLYANIEKLFVVPPGAFAPPPKIYSEVLRLTMQPKLPSLRVPEREFIDFLKLSFAQKRKTLVNNLKSSYPADALRAALKGAGLRGDVRAEAISLEKAADMFRELERLAKPLAS
jgi:16S rRNA (adenine1518-N6/adenine1519-N6)-dimethyltransferase